MAFSFKKLDLEPAILITPECFNDARGYFYETFKASEFIQHNIQGDFVQTNESCSHKGVVRGLHYQLDPFAQGKLVRVVCGVLQDVIVDIRRGSPNFGKHFSVELSAENKLILWVPPGFAHGTMTLADDTILLYNCSAEYNPETERSICWNDPALKIIWPLQADLQISEKDASAPPLKTAEINYQYSDSK
ncbi:MAG: dTDP-4-dehydrorhamnose 3,5-epimerase [Gammaproteobacteria bacterium]|nr:dTDP-4-dehydrorhamnose 3,5-epimerase [Gammaproteobacteria bacterium]